MNARARIAAVLCVAVATVLATSNTARETLSQATSPRPHARLSVASASEGAELSTARAFLTGYLAYLSGRAPASAIHDATSELSRALTLQRRVIPPTAAAREARIVSLAPAGIQLGQPAVVVLVNGGELASYQLTLLLAREDGRLLVSRVEGS